MVMGWGIAATMGVIFLGERIGPLRRDIYGKLPIIGHRYDDWRVEPAATSKNVIEEEGGE
jgi:ubiquinol-cytochrome-c reductase complex QCR10 subunit